MNLETKELNINVAGKEGLTRAYKIQRHTPSSPMCFIRTVTGHMLFCQEDHPVWIQSLDGQPTVVEAKDVVMFHDRIWVNNTEHSLEFVYGVEPPDVDVLFDILLNIFKDPTSHIISNHSEYLTGDNIYNFCINVDYLSKISNSNLTYLLYHFLFDNNETKSKIFSFNFVTQLKMVADHLSHTCAFDINTDDGLVYWTLKNAVPSDKLIQDINTYVDIEQVVPGIEGYQGYVYDLKTESEEFLNNNVQTHNSFHCFHGDSIVDVRGLSIDSEGFSLECLFDFANDRLNLPIIYDVPFSNGMTQDEIDLSSVNISVLDRGTDLSNYQYIKILKVIRHKQDPTTRMICIKFDNKSDNNEKQIISQDNHSHFKIDPKTLNFVLTEAKNLKVGDHLYSTPQKYNIAEITSIEYVDDVDEYVYDLTTASGTLFVNNIYTHNTGGAVVFKKVDILKELSDSITDDEEKYLAGMIYQKDNDLYSNTEVTTIKINKSIFKDEYAIEKVGNTYKLPLGYFRMYIGNIEVNATIEMPVEINIHDDYNETADSITLMYGKDVKLFTIKFFKIAPEKIAQSLDALVAGKGPWETPENLYKKFYEALSTFGPWDSCHLEVILATILRNKKDPMIAARLKEPYDPELHSIKSLPSIISWSLGVAYENLGKSLTFGLISKDSKKYSQIEKVLFGEPLSELSIEKLKEKKK